MKTSSDLLERYAQDIAGVLGCFDRVVVTGTLTEVAHPDAMRAVLYREGIRCFDIGQFAEPLRERIRDNAIEVARTAGVEVEYLRRSKGVRKEELVAKVLAKRGGHPVLVQVLSVMEACTAFKPWHDKATGRTGLKMAPGKCATDYFYLIDPELGLIYVRVPTWLPCRLQIYFNAHHWLAAQLRKEGIAFKMEDNAFVEIARWDCAQELVRSFCVAQWERKFRELAARFCPARPPVSLPIPLRLLGGGKVHARLPLERHAGGVFPGRGLQTSRAARPALRGDQPARGARGAHARPGGSPISSLHYSPPPPRRFWGQRFSPVAEAQSDFKTLVEGTRIKHALGRQSLKMYDKGRVLRIEATSNDITFFRHHRKMLAHRPASLFPSASSVVSRDGREESKMAALKKSIYSLSDVVEILAAACARYLGFLGTLEDDTPQRHDLDKISRTVRDDKERTWRGFNLFLKEDQKVLLAILRGEFAIHGLSNKRLRALLTQKTSAQIARILRRLRNHGLIKRVARTYRYYLSALGQRLLLAARKLFEHVLIPNLQPQPA